MTWDGIIESVAKKVYQATGIPVAIEAFSVECTPLQWRVLYMREEIALLQDIDDVLLEDSILGAMDTIKTLSIDARMEIMRKRLDQLSDAVLAELKLKDMDAEILGDIMFTIEDMGYALKHYETEREERGYPDIALTARWDIVAVSHTLDYDVEPPMDAATMAAELAREIIEHL